MLRSMTGFGLAELDTEKFTIKVEIKSLNSKFLEMNLRMPRQWQHKELELRKELTKLIERGTAQVNLNISYKMVQDKVMPVNQEVAAYYLAEIKKMSIGTGWAPEQLLNNVFTIPNIIQANEDTPGDDDWKEILKVVQLAYTEFDQFRCDEGNMLAGELKKMCRSVAEKLDELTPFEEERISTVKERILKDLQTLNQEQMDKNRFEQELIYYIEKLDISEEKTRLKQHCDYFLETVDTASSGKKLNFIAQEMGREINTIGSKSNHHLMQRRVVEMKDELEKIKEQINNVL
ncbi:MAG: YicC/YloC family endoribonuclease [Bacteroidota bacterium]|nr:YicC/YloC family endoribonuclease [Bacteroidota bacterium]